MMELSNEDQLRLNVMLAQEVQAVRIDENRLAVHALTEHDEARVGLTPNCRTDQYIKLVREFLSGYFLGSPGGYPVFISRWTRMGQARDESLGKLLLLGEPEAVVAVVHAPGITPEIARRAWWCMPESENARCLLETEQVVNSDLGLALAEHLYEHLAFETEPCKIIDSVRLMLQPGLINQSKQQKLWSMAQRKNVYKVGFLQAMPNHLPSDKAERDDFQLIQNKLEQEIIQGNEYAKFVLWLVSSSGQNYIDTVYSVLKKPANQDVVVSLLNTIRDRFYQALPCKQYSYKREIEAIDQSVEDLVTPGSELFLMSDSQWQALVQHHDDMKETLSAMIWLAHVSEEIVTPVFAQTTAEGTLMRKKLKPVTDSLFFRITTLLGS
ncbi:MAG: sulfur reduction protein DsrS [Gammaproteobacteria bacterium]|nr:MAG: sulfur reduction protein DsrS [Gammaproteobacteria bacterium]